jgi:hypothetical protein
MHDSTKPSQTQTTQPTTDNQAGKEYLNFHIQHVAPSAWSVTKYLQKANEAQRKKWTARRNKPIFSSVSEALLSSTSFSLIPSLCYNTTNLESKTRGGAATVPEQKSYVEERQKKLAQLLVIHIPSNDKK